MLKDFRLLIVAGPILLLIGWILPGEPFAQKTESVSSIQPQPYSRLSPGELFIKEHLTNQDLTLKTNLQASRNEEEHIAQGDETLSESLGLWMMYAVEKGDRFLFAQNVNILQTRFYQDGWVVWKAGTKTTSAVSTNALVDDLRIAEALYLAADKWGEKQYAQLADEIGQSVLEHQVKDGLLVDFYDWKHQHASDAMTLSYLNVAALQIMKERQQVDEELYHHVYAFLDELPTRQGFFPFSYQLVEKEYVYQQEVNLIDQLYIAYHRAQVGMKSPELWQFLQEEFARHGLLYGRYDAASKQPVVEYESPAVYGLAILTASELKDYSFALELYERMLRQQIRRPENAFYGGYVDMSRMDTHSFDNLLPLLAERRLFNDGALQ